MPEKIVSADGTLRKDVAPGTRFGRLVIVGFFGRRTKSGCAYLRCKCDCGTVKEIIAQGLLNGFVISCGCRKRELSRDMGIGCATHGEAHKTPEYLTWQSMRQRCRSPKDKRWDRYGGRGIKVCDRWNNSYPAFLEDMGRRPTPHHQIDRINNDGNYEPENCRWATAKEQSLNRRSNRRITFNGETLCVTEWANRLGLNKTTLMERLNSQKWSIEKALTAPIQQSKVRFHE
jgi:hypothetical protein